MTAEQAVALGRVYYVAPDYSLQLVTVVGRPRGDSCDTVSLSVADGIVAVHADWCFATRGEAVAGALGLVREDLAATRERLRALSHRELQLEAGDVDGEFAAVERNAASGRALMKAAEEVFGGPLCCEKCYDAKHADNAELLVSRPMFLCPDCGNKRCPKATNHDLGCSGSNSPGQKGSSWEGVRPFAAVEREIGIPVTDGLCPKCGGTCVDMIGAAVCGLCRGTGEAAMTPAQLEAFQVACDALPVTATDDDLDDDLDDDDTPILQPDEGEPVGTMERAG